MTELEELGVRLAIKLKGSVEELPLGFDKLVNQIIGLSTAQSVEQPKQSPSAAVQPREPRSSKS